MAYLDVGGAGFSRRRSIPPEAWEEFAQRRFEDGQCGTNYGDVDFEKCPTVGLGLVV